MYTRRGHGYRGRGYSNHGQRGHNHNRGNFANPRHRGNFRHLQNYQGPQYHRGNGNSQRGFHCGNGNTQTRIYYATECNQPMGQAQQQNVFNAQSTNSTQQQSQRIKRNNDQQHFLGPLSSQ